MTDELTMEELLKAAETLVSKRPIKIGCTSIEPFCFDVYEPIEIPCIITCRCGIVYNTIATRRKDWSEFYKVLEYKTLDCPKCMTIETWLYNHFIAKEIQ